jgi:hypothetical protein
LVPEFFSQPEFFVGTQLPKWAGSAFVFVYMQRKALESDFVSTQLHKWIDAHFGLRVPIRLVGSRTQRPINWSFPFDFSQTILASALVSSSRKECRYLNLYSDGSVYLYTIAIGGSSRKSSVADSFAVDELRIVQSCGPSIVVLTDELCLVKSSGILKLSESFSSAVLVASYEQNLTFVLENGDIFQDQTCICSIVYSTPVYVSINHNFDLLVVATLESTLLFYSVSGMFKSRSWLAGEIVRQILITEGWGFVVVLTAQNLYLFNVNGSLIRSVGNTKSLMLLCCWKDAKGFDWLCGVDNRGRLGCCEAFYLSIAESICYCRGTVIALHYLTDCRSISAVTQDGKCFIVPCPD